MFVGVWRLCGAFLCLCKSVHNCMLNCCANGYACFWFYGSVCLRLQGLCVCVSMDLYVCVSKDLCVFGSMDLRVFGSMNLDLPYVSND